MPPYCPPTRVTNGLAVATLVLGITTPCTSPLLAVIVGIISLRQIKRRGERGRGLAIGGLVAVRLWFAAAGVAIAMSVAGEADRDDAGQITESGRLSTEDLSPDAWEEGDRKIVCVAYFTDGPRTGSLAG